MAAQSVWHRLPAARHAAASGQYHTVLRLARTAKGWTLLEAGQHTGYSTSTMSRLETGARPLRDVTLLRRLAKIFDIPPDLFGLTTPSAPQTHDATAGAIVEQDEPATGGGEAVHRRVFLLGLASTPILARTSTPTPPPSTPGRLVDALELLLLQPLPPASDRDPETLAPRLTAIKAAFQRCRYTAVADALPALVADALHHSPHHPAVHAILAEAYNTAANILIKLDTPGLGWIAADRAMTAARHSTDPVVLASVTRNMVSLCRREHRYTTAQDLAVAAADQLDLTGPHPDQARLSLYGLLMCNAGYAAAQDGDRSRATDLLHLADTAATRLGGDHNAHWSAFGPTNVTSHRISAAIALGDAGTAIDHAATIPTGAISIPERAVRIWFDVARAYHQWAKPDKCLQALLVAERIAPEEIRHRPAVHTLVTDLLTAPSTPNMAGVRDLARRVGATP